MHLYTDHARQFMMMQRHNPISWNSNIAFLFCIHTFPFANKLKAIFKSFNFAKLEQIKRYIEHVIFFHLTSNTI